METKGKQRNRKFGVIKPRGVGWKVDSWVIIVVGHSPSTWHSHISTTMPNNRDLTNVP